MYVKLKHFFKAKGAFMNDFWKNQNEIDTWLEHIGWKIWLDFGEKKNKKQAAKLWKCCFKNSQKDIFVLGEVTILLELFAPKWQVLWHSSQQFLCLFYYQCLYCNVWPCGILYSILEDIWAKIVSFYLHNPYIPCLFTCKKQVVVVSTYYTICIVHLEKK